MRLQPLGLIDNWLRYLRDVQLWNREELAALEDFDARADRLAELNVDAQVANVCHTTIVQDAWRRGQAVAMHGWIYSLHDGLLRDLGMVIGSPALGTRCLWVVVAHRQASLVDARTHRALRLCLCPRLQLHLRRPT
jgi:hypothetical protein